MLWLLSPVYDIWDIGVPTLALPGASSAEAEDGCGEYRGLPAVPVAREDPG